MKQDYSWLWVSLVCLTGLLGFPVSVAAQAPDTIMVVGDAAQVVPDIPVTIAGRVFDTREGTPIPGMVVYIEGQQDTFITNRLGLFLIDAPPGQHRLHVMYRRLGSGQVVIALTVHTTGTIQIGVPPEVFQMAAVEIAARANDAHVQQVTSGVTAIKASEFRAIPTLLGEMDVIRSVLLLPGVTNTGEGAGGFNVRGGRVDQNLVLLDGAQLYNTSHLLGFFSVFNPELIDQFTLYKGHIPARFGGRLASVLEVDQKEGDFDKWTFSGGSGLVSSRALVQGPIQPGKTAMLAGVRGAYPTWILRQVKNINVRNSSAFYYDADLVLNHRFNDNNQLSVAYHGGQDRFRYSNSLGTGWDSHLLRARWRHILAKGRGLSTFTAASGTYTNRLDDLTGVDAGRLTNGMQYLQLKEHLSSTLGARHTLNGGVDMVVYRPRDETVEPLGSGSGRVADQLPKTRGMELGLYVEDEIRVSARLGIVLGMRYSYFQEMGPGTLYTYAEGLARTPSRITDTLTYGPWAVMQAYGGLEPRLSLRQALGATQALKLSYSRTRQYVHLISNSAAPAPIDIWQMSSRYIPPQVGDNLSVGYYHNFQQNIWETVLEVFVRRSQGLVAYKDFAQLLLNDHLETELLTGLGYAYGGELLIKRTRGTLTGWLGYAYTRSLLQVAGPTEEERINQGDWFPADYDQPHQLNIVTNLRVGKNSSLGLNAVYHSGRPYTPLVSSYYAGQTAVPDFADRNTGRIPDYYRLDFSVTFGDVIKAWKDDLNFSLYNVLARKNPYSVYFLRQSAIKLSVLGAAFPSLTYNVYF